MSKYVLNIYGGSYGTSQNKRFWLDHTSTYVKDQ